MKYYTLYELVFPLCFLIVASWLLFVGGRGLIKKQAVAFSRVLSFVFTTVFVLPFFLLSWNIVLFGPRGSKPDINEFAVVVLPLVLLLCWRWMRGYTIIGVREGELRELLSREAIELDVVKTPLHALGSIGLRATKNLQESDSPNGELEKILSADFHEIDTRSFKLQLVLGSILVIAALAIRYLA